MPDPTLYESTYQWTCNACHTEVLAIRRHEKTQLVSVACPSCAFRMLVSPTIRREEPRDHERAEHADRAPTHRRDHRPQRAARCFVRQ